MIRALLRDLERRDNTVSLLYPLPPCAVLFPETYRPRFRIIGDCRRKLWYAVALTYAREAGARR